MKLSLLCCSFIVASSVMAFADGSASTGLPALEKQTIQTGGERGEVVLLAQNSNRDQETNPNGKLKGWAKNNKGKGKGKTNAKEDREQEAKEEAAAKTETPAATAPASQTPATTPAVTTPPATTTTPPATAPSTPAPAVGKAAPAPAVSTTPAQVRAELGQRISRINTLDNSAPVALAGLGAVARETGVSVARLQAQRQEFPVGTGGLLVANEMAKATGKPVATFLKQRLAKRDWEVMASENKFDLGAMLPKLSRVESAMANARTQQQKKK